MYKEINDNDVIKYMIKKLGYSRKNAKKEIEEIGKGWLIGNQFRDCINFTHKRKWWINYNNIIDKPSLKNRVMWKLQEIKNK